MSEKEKLLENFIEKSGKSKQEIEKLVADKVNELSGLVSEEGAIYILANELNVKLDQDRPKREVDEIKIENITEPKTPTSLMCKVIKIYDKVNFSSKSGSEGSVQSILVGDETGIIRVVFWNDKTEILENVHDKDILKIINAYTRENTNSERIEIHFGQYSDIEINPEGIEIELPEFTPTQIEFKDKKVNELEEGDKNVKISGVITSFDIPRYYFGCPQCFKKVFQDEGIYKCAQHDEVEARRIPIVNIIVDDGTASLTIVGFRDRAEELTNLKTEDLLKLTEDIDKYNAFSKSMIGGKLEVGGNVSLSQLTGDKQVLANQVLNLEIKEIEEIAKELVEEDKEKNKNQNSSIDDEDLELDEIDFDDDLL